MGVLEVSMETGLERGGDGGLLGDWFREGWGWRSPWRLVEGKERERGRREGGREGGKDRLPEREREEQEGRQTLEMLIRTPSV